VSDGIGRAQPKLQWSVLSDGDLERIDDAVLTTLERVGVAFPSPRALRILEGGGCRVDEATGVVRLPRQMVREALSWAPRDVVLAGRDPAHDLPLDLRHSYLSNDASGVEVVDAHLGCNRPSTLADVADSARVVDALPAVAYYWGPAVAAGDTPLGTRALHESAAVFANTAKHYQAVTCVGEKSARYLVEMAAAIAGGTDELRRRPIVSMIQCPVDPLGNDRVGLEAGLVAAEYGVPCGFLSLTLGCGTAPATLAGNLVVNAATVLADLVLLQLASPGAPIFMGSAPSVIDLKTGGYTGGSPEDYLLAAAATQLAHFYGLPMAMGTMATGAKEPDWHAAVDDSLSTFASVMSSADMMNGCGLLNGSKILSYPHLVMETEIYSIVQRMSQGITVDDESLALDVIEKVGPNGTYLSERHTRRHMKEIWRPTVFDRSPYEVWLREGKQGALAKATEIAEQILESYHPEPLAEDLTAELAAIVAGADAEMRDS
jgi:trimethylamine--corrinoid protein Co-methyltransferase